MSKVHHAGVLRAVLAAAVIGAAGGAQAQEQPPIIIDAATNMPISVTGLSSGAMTTLQQGGSVTANTPGGETIRLQGEVYIPGIWTDPDGCQHWVMDDGAEGYMAPILTRQGKPICNGGPAGREQFVIRKYDVPFTGKVK